MGPVCAEVIEERGSGVEAWMKRKLSRLRMFCLNIQRNYTDTSKGSPFVFLSVYRSSGLKRPKSWFRAGASVLTPNPDVIA